ncbi:MAG: hypothetical protein AAF468_06590 [Pseudomonadota bacterium]
MSVALSTASFASYSQYCLASAVFIFHQLGRWSVCHCSCERRGHNADRIQFKGGDFKFFDLYVKVIVISQQSYGCVVSGCNRTSHKKLKNKGKIRAGLARQDFHPFRAHREKIHMASIARLEQI